MHQLQVCALVLTADIVGAARLSRGLAPSAVHRRDPDIKQSRTVGAIAVDRQILARQRVEDDPTGHQLFGGKWKGHRLLETIEVSTTGRPVVRPRADQHGRWRLGRPE